MYKIAVIGDKDSVQGFLALGLDVYPAFGAQEAKETLISLAKSDCAVIYITENLAKDIMDTIAQYSERMLPAIILIPNNAGSLGIGLAGVKKSVERAVGADILFGNE